MMGAHEMAADLAARLQLKRRNRGWSGSCPACGYARAFSIWLGKGARPSLFCGNGCTREDLGAAARNALGAAWMPPPCQADAKAERARAADAKQAAAQRLWAGSASCAGTAAARYLARRGIGHAANSIALRFRGDCSHPDGGRLPAMVALVQDAGGQLTAVHRTYLTPDGSKASADPVKASLGPVWGGAVRLDPVGPVLTIGEGIETAASAGLLLRLPAWAAISAGNLASGLLLPPEVREVVIAVDPDSAGRAAAAAALARWQTEGRRVRIAVPDTTGQDFNDLLRHRVQHAGEIIHG